MGYPFDKGVDPKKQIDPKDPCPRDWELVSGRDMSRLFWGGTAWPRNIMDWEKRELARMANLQPA